jgi:hypothetical protein
MSRRKLWRLECRSKSTLIGHKFTFLNPFLDDLLERRLEVRVLCSDAKLFPEIVEAATLKPNQSNAQETG